MKNIYTFIISFLFVINIYATEGDTTHIKFHNKTNLTWYGNYDQRGAFPAVGITWNRILLKYTMGCSSHGCSGWDYTTHIQYLKPTGKLDSSIAKIDSVTKDTFYNVYEVKEPFELARVITPYGTYMRDGVLGFNNSWQQVYWFDVTDFEPFLHDSATLRVFYSGWQDGYSATLDFYFIEGNPPRKVLSYQNLWGAGGGSFGYANSNDFETKFMNEKKIYKLPNAKSSRLTFTPSGHGFDNDVYAAEFLDEVYTVKINKNSFASDHIWNDQCGMNPLYPQGGTWLLDRANWCPGEKVGIFSYEIGDSLKSDTNILDIDFAPFTWSGNQQPSYTVSSVLFQFDQYQYINEASLEDIIAPSSDPNYIRMNPMCDNPVISIKNNGKNDLTSLKISFGMKGNTPQTYQWTGNLKFNQTQKITLPILDWTSVQANPLFEVSISEPNGKQDEVIYNNTRNSIALITPKLENKIVVWFKTNRAGGENIYRFKDVYGNIVFEKKGFMNDSVILYKDTINLPNGCINLELTDEGKDGIDWWANSKVLKSGYFWMRNYSTNTWMKFNNDFGTALQYRFNTNFGLPVSETPATYIGFEVFPNPTQEYIYIQSFTPDLRASVYISDLTGKTIYQSTMIDHTQIDVHSFAKGMYLIRIDDGSHYYIKKILVD